MKYYSIKIERIGSSMIYPEGYVSGIDKYVRESLYYNDMTKLFIALPDNITFEGQNITEMTLAEAVAFADQYSPKVTVINDDGRVRLAEIKSRIGEPLTEEDLKVIDPEDNTPGIVWSRSLSARLVALDNEV